MMMMMMMLLLLLLLLPDVVPSYRKSSRRFDVGVFDIDLPDGDGVALAHTALERRLAQELGPLAKKMEGVMRLVQHNRQDLKSSRRRTAGELGMDVVSSSPGPPSGLRITKK